MYLWHTDEHMRHTQFTLEIPSLFWGFSTSSLQIPTYVCSIQADARQSSLNGFLMTINRECDSWKRLLGYPLHVVWHIVPYKLWYLYASELSPGASLQTSARRCLWGRWWKAASALFTHESRYTVLFPFITGAWLALRWLEELALKRANSESRVSTKKLKKPQNIFQSFTLPSLFTE